MKENSLDSHRGKVADSKVGATAKADPTATNFDDDYNEWELGIGDLIIDLDADIEKNNEKSGVTVVQQTATAFSMSSGKGRANSNAAVEHQATVDKGLKMKIKRTKPTKTSEAKHEIVKSDTKPSSPVETLNGNVGLAAANTVDGKPKHVSSKGRGGSHREKKERTKEKEKGSSSSSSSSKSVDMNGLLMSSSSGPTLPTPTIKLTTSNVNMNSITSPTVNLGVPANLVSLNLSTSNSTTYTSNSSGSHSGNTTSQAPMPTLSVKLDSKFSSVPITSTTSSSSTTTPTATVKLEDTVRKLEDSMRSISMKRMRINMEKSVEKVDRTTSPRPPEMHDMCIGTSVGTITEPECLGPCEPGTSVTLEGIVWHETEGGVLVVNVTWRGKTYVGTLLDCTKHDWAPPRFCESPTSDVEARTPKGRGKRGRSNAATPVDMSNYTETRSSVHSKLRNAGKGRRATNAGFQAPPSPAKSDSTPIVGVKRKGRTPDLELNRELEVRSSKRSRSQSRGTPTNSSTPPEQPNSPVLIECPKPNCKKRYRHINGLRYHQTHAHHGSGSGVEDSLDEQTKDMSSDNEESMQENVSVPHSPGAVSDKNLRSSPRPFTGKTPAPPERKASPSSQPNASVPGAGSETFTQPPSTQPTSDLTTLATVAISDSKGGAKIGNLRFGQSSPNHAGVPSETDTSNVSTPPAIAAPVVSSPSSLNTSNTVQQGSQRCTTTTTTTTTTTITTITTSPTSQVYQFTHAPIGSLTTTTVSTVRSPSTTTVPVTSNNLTPTTTIGSPPTMATSFNTASVEKQKPKQEKTEKFKLKPPLTVQRPLTQPSGPPPQVIPISPSLPPSQPNVMTPSASPQAAVTHPTLAANIKPIQPKPVVLNDPNALNPSLENIKKEKSKHKKKSKDKERRTGEGSPGQNEGKLQGLEVMDKLNGGVYSKVTEVLTKDGVRELVAPHLQNSAYPMTPVSRTIESPLDVNAGDGSNTANENVQSPAYSDISDANDTAPVLESEVQNKEKEEEKTKAPSEPTPPPASNIGPFGMYFPYRQPPYLMPSVPPQTSVPQTVTPDKPKEGNAEKVDGCIKEQKQWSDRERISGSNTSSETEKKESMGTSSQPTNQTNVSDYQLQQQKLLQPQYTYPYGYTSYPYHQVDPSYHMHLMTSDPHIKQQMEKCMEERDRLYKDLFDRPKEATNKETPEKNKVQVKIEPEKRKSCTGEVMKASPQSATSVSSHKEREVHHGQSQSTKLDSSSSNLKEKQNENHQILKENIELKSQMENKSKYDRYNPSVHYHPEEARHYYSHIYSDKYLESQKPEEVRRKEECVPTKQPMADTKTQGPAKESIKPPTSVHSSHSSSPKSNPNPVKELVNKEVPKKETSLTEGSKNSDNTEGSSKDKREVERPKQQEGQKPTMETQGPPPPTSSYAYMHPQFMQSSPYAPISFDHSMYRSMLMTPGAFPSSPYLHPQMRYHVPPNDHQSGHLSPKMHSGGSTKALDLLQHHASQYYTSHKIHELQERALKSPPTSLNQSTPTAINKIVDNPLAVKNEPNTPGNGLERRSPPLQRHLHTHHHTHVGVSYPILGQFDPYGSKPLVRH